MDDIKVQIKSQKSKIGLLILFVLLFLLSSHVVFAQSTGESIVVGDNAFVVQLQREVQNPENKYITYNFVIYSNIDSDRVELEWSVSGASQAVSDKFKTLSVNAGEQINEQFVIWPRAAGKTNVRVELRSYAAESNHVAAANDEFITDPNFEIAPTTDEYEQAKQNLTIRNVIIAVVVGLVAIIGGFLAFARFKKWLDRGKKPSMWE